MTQQQLSQLEKDGKALIVESDFDKCNYAIDPDGKGMWVIVDDKVIGIAAENVESFFYEALDTWCIHGKQKQIKSA